MDPYPSTPRKVGEGRAPAVGRAGRPDRPRDPIARSARRRLQSGNARTRKVGPRTPRARGTRARRSRLPPAHAASCPTGGPGEAVTESDAPPGPNPGPYGAPEALTRGQAPEAHGPGEVLPRPGECPGRRGRPGRQSTGRQCTGPIGRASGASAPRGLEGRTGDRSHRVGHARRRVN